MEERQDPEIEQEETAVPSETDEAPSDADEILPEAEDEAVDSEPPQEEQSGSSEDESPQDDEAEVSEDEAPSDERQEDCAGTEEAAPVEEVTAITVAEEPDAPSSEPEETETDVDTAADDISGADGDDDAGETPLPVTSADTWTILKTAVWAAAVVLLSAMLVNAVLTVSAGKLRLMAYVDGESVGWTDEPYFLADCAADVERLASDTLGRKVKLNSVFSWKLLLDDGGSSEADARQCRALLLTKLDEPLCMLFRLYVDGRPVVCARDRETLENVIASLEDQVLRTAKLRDSGTVSVRIDNKFTIEQDVGTEAVCKTEEEILALLWPAAQTADGTDPYFDYGIPHTLNQTGETDYSSLIRYDTVTYAYSTEIVPYTVVHETSPYYFNDMTFLQTEGSDGLVEHITEVVRRGGEIVSETPFKDETIVRMVPETWITGTREPPPVGSTGTYIWPLQNDFMISSLFGINRGEMDGEAYHYGIDLTGEIGNNVYAADGGTVIWAGRKSTYGKLIIVRLDDHTVNLYGHLDEILVEVGDELYQGKLIGKLGQTGYATAPHLHFEIRLFDVAVDPLPYMPEH